MFPIYFTKDCLRVRYLWKDESEFFSGKRFVPQQAALTAIQRNPRSVQVMINQEASLIKSNASYQYLILTLLIVEGLSHELCPSASWRVLQCHQELLKAVLSTSRELPAPGNTSMPQALVEWGCLSGLGLAAPLAGNGFVSLMAAGGQGLEWVSLEGIGDWLSVAQAK